MQKKIILQILLGNTEKEDPFHQRESNLQKRSIGNIIRLLFGGNLISLYSFPSQS